ncbi:YunG family protein [Bacillus sp. KH172YL63]|uniref:YunG family protein n=1 Tax=Bacillus sp. KH172YL63 TaxID=2709784 RepID=UPI0013E45BC9|nr:hypothetical protein [Bacillus sp. KH172YL63]BCB03950.1 hypothetical protein KH172YL63_20830 [Bacillus sp. KH172YL63]
MGVVSIVSNSFHKLELPERITYLQNTFQKTWSIHSSTKWIKSNPAKGQCGVTSLVANDVLGGEILKTPMTEGWHYYNRFEGCRHDFTSSQFQKPVEYEDIPSSREEAFTDTTIEQYSYLRGLVLLELTTINQPEES